MSTEPEQRIPAERDLDALCEDISELALQYDITIGTAESLTAGNLAAMLGKAPSSGEWFHGGIVAYAKQVKHSLLEVPEGPVVTEEAAATMAKTTASLLGVDLSVAVTGEAGPRTQEDAPAGTVWFGVCDRGNVTTERKIFDGDPPDILAATLGHSLSTLLRHARRRES